MYRAPEIDYDATDMIYSYHVDVWSIGCVLFELVCGYTLHPINSANDTSIFVAEMMKISPDDKTTRTSRIKALKERTHKQVYTDVLDRFSLCGDRKCENIPDDYTRLIAMCLIPDSQMRITSRDLLTLANDLFKKNTRNNVIPLYTVKYDSDETECLTNVSLDIIKHLRDCACSCAESIYQDFASVASVTFTTQLACIYISTCVYSNSNADRAIMKFVDIDTLHAECRRILTTLDGRLL